MRKSEFEALIQAEVTKQVKLVVPKLVKPLVQEAVAGALASLLAEGITRGTSVKKPVLSPDIPQSKPVRVATPERTNESAEIEREKIRKRLRSMQESPGPIGIDASKFGGGMVGNILAETATSMVEGPDVESILDYGSDLPIDSETVNAITRDYSALMNRMKQTGKLNG